MKDNLVDLSIYEFWFVTGSQDLYGEETLRAVSEHSKKMVEGLNASRLFPAPLVCKPTLLTAAGIRTLLEEATASPRCAGIIAWMHTFSPAKMWIAGLSALKKPLLQFNTQYNRDIPWAKIDMDFMNLNQSAHGDREFGYLTARMDIPRTVLAGHWEDGSIRARMAEWIRAALGLADGRSLRIARFGDNMRDVAVTDGDKVEAMIQLGWSVPYYGIGDLVERMAAVKVSDIEALVDEYRACYEMPGIDFSALEQVREQARIELALRAFLSDTECRAFTTNFQDLHGMKQLPGLACQRLMASGYGFAGEGDWKTAAMVRLFKVMSEGLATEGEGKGSSFMEDYTYHFEPGAERILGAHMLEICPTIANKRPRLEVHPLGIGDREDPARLVFEGKAGPALVAAVVDMGTRLRCVANEITVFDLPNEVPKLPVARVLWKPQPSLSTSSEAWILAGGGHHSAFSNLITTNMLRDWAEMAGVECVVVDESTRIPQWRNELRWNAAAWRR